MRAANSARFELNGAARDDLHDSSLVGESSRQERADGRGPKALVRFGITGMCPRMGCSAGCSPLPVRHLLFGGVKDNWHNVETANSGTDSQEYRGAPHV